jgi:hypothetical protein
MSLRALPLLVWLAGCGDAPEQHTGFGTSPLTTTEGQAVHAALFTSPQPPERGLDEAKLRLTGADGQPLDGLTLTVTPWMPEHGHGTSVSPTVTPIGDGTWTVSNLYLAMPGQWQLRVDVSGAVNDELVASFDIP